MINQNLLLTGDDGYNLTKSLRFRSSASAYLNRTPAGASNRKTWTWSGWVKRGSLGSTVQILHCYDGASSRRSSIQFNSDNTIGWDQGGSGTSGLIDTVAVYRDPSAWYHLVCVADYSNGIPANRALIYINGVLQTVTTADDFDNADGLINSTNAHQIASQGGTGNFFDGYMTEINFIDGQALTPSSFGETSTTTGVWIPKKFVGTYGTNGFYLPFTDNSALTTSSNAGLGKDFSGNANYFATNGISITSGSTYDSMTDVPTLTSATTANYAVLNSLVGVTNTTLSNGNLTFTKTGISDIVLPSTIAMPSGKFYWETTLTSVSSASNIALGLIQQDAPSAATGTWPGAADAAIVVFGGSGNLYVNGTTSSGTGLSLATNDVVGLALDMSAATLAIYKNGSLVYTATSLVVTKPYLALFNSYGNGESQAVNFGQQPFAHTPPSGFVALNTFNLPTPTIGATAAELANEYFDVTTYTGNGTTQSITNSSSMQPDWVWLKCRSTNYRNQLYDSVRGATKALFSDSTDAEGTFQGVTAFNANGFSLGAELGANASGDTFVGWQWRAGGAAVTNTQGSITSTVSANTTAGFSIVTWTGSGSTATIGHGLGVAPSMFIWFHRTNAGAYSHITYHASLPSAAFVVYLNLTIAQSNDNNAFNSTAPTSSVFTVGGYNSADTMVAYCFAPVAGYSAFGSYTGNNASDGTFVYLGFRPKFIMIKSTSAGTEWVMVDSTRSTYNLVDTSLYANRSYSESTIGTVDDIDFLSNGFKLRNNTGYVNASQTYIYMAFAESPFKYANAR